MSASHKGAVKQSGLSRHPSSAIPFRRGNHPAARGYKEARYKRVDVARVDRAWRSLVDQGKVEVKKSRFIAAAMNTSVQTATRYRRVLHALGLIEDIPGEWNNAPRDDYRATFDGSAIEDGNGYSDYCDLNDFNEPAVVRLLSGDPESFSLVVAQLAGDEDVDLYVVSRGLPVDNGPLARFARSVPASVWFDPYGPRTVCLTGLHNKPQFYRPPVYLRETNLGTGRWNPVPDGDLPTPVVVVPTMTTAARSHARSASPTSRLPAGVVSVPDLVDFFGWSRATVNRRLTDWLQTGKAVKVKRGRYKLLLPEFAVPADTSPGRSGRGPAPQRAVPVEDLAPTIVRANSTEVVCG